MKYTAEVPSEAAVRDLVCISWRDITINTICSKDVVLLSPCHCRRLGAIWYSVDGNLLGF